MSRRLTVKADPSAVSMARAIRTAARSAPPSVLTVGALGDLAAELGGIDVAARGLLPGVPVQPSREPDYRASHRPTFAGRRP